jgi:hypothetical protein
MFGLVVECFSRWRRPVAESMFGPKSYSGRQSQMTTPFTGRMVGKGWRMSSLFETNLWGRQRDGRPALCPCAASVSGAKTKSWKMAMPARFPPLCPARPLRPSSPTGGRRSTCKCKCQSWPFHDREFHSSFPSSPRLRARIAGHGEREIGGRYCRFAKAG